MFLFITNIISSVSDITKQFIDFIIENNLFSLFMVGIIGIAISQLLTAIKTNLLEYYLNKLFKTSDNNLINIFTSFLQFLIIIIFIYFIYKYLIKPVSNKYNASKFNDVAWKKDLLAELKLIRNQMK